MPYSNHFFCYRMVYRYIVLSLIMNAVFFQVWILMRFYWISYKAGVTIKTLTSTVYHFV